MRACCFESHAICSGSSNKLARVFHCSVTDFKTSPDLFKKKWERLKEGFRCAERCGKIISENFLKERS